MQRKRQPYKQTAEALETFMYKLAWERREVLFFFPPWDVEKPRRMSDLDRVFKGKKVVSGQGNKKSQYKT